MTSRSMNPVNLGKLLTEQQNQNSVDIDLKSTAEIVQIFHQEDRTALSAVEAETDAIVMVVEAITATFSSGGRLFYIGAGTSGRLGVLDASECPPTFGSAPNMVQGIIAGGDFALRNPVEAEEDQDKAGAKAIREHNVTDLDLVIGIASSGRTPYVLGGMKEAKKIGAQAGIICCTPPSNYVQAIADYVIAPIVGPEIIAGSTRLKSGTATKLVLNILTTASMIQQGKVYGNLMVDVKASNQKMTDRALRIIIDITGCNLPTAKHKLIEADGRAKTAIIMITKKLNRADATQLLENHKGFLRPALHH